MSNVNDDQIVASNAVIDEVWIVSRRKHSNTGDVRLSSQARIFRQQLARGAYLSRDGSCRARAVLRNVLVDFRDVSAGTRSVPQSHRPHFFQSAAISSSLTNSPLLGLSETFKHGSAMGLGHNERVAPGSSNLLQHFRDISLPIFRKLSHLFDGVFKNLGHWNSLTQLETKCEMRPLISQP